MEDKSDSDRPVTAKGYKGPKWLIDRIPRFSASSENDN